MVLLKTGISHEMHEGVQGISILRLTRLTLLDWPYYASFQSCIMVIWYLSMEKPNGMIHSVYRDGE